ncbi:hypothetical protein L3X38_000093 [Prunus dulcis]|uniref:Uncharacterized protein n=1 Tax=Prunus dulcis TaxID=3755 RepID=A0AAD4UQC7_PRUDU|nr:hypothetical protein L3X38_000093 [Prunus dulcis]
MNPKENRVHYEKENLGCFKVQKGRAWWGLENVLRKRDFEDYRSWTRLCLHCTSQELHARDSHSLIQSTGSSAWFNSVLYRRRYVVRRMSFRERMPEKDVKVSTVMDTKNRLSSKTKIKYDALDKLNEELVMHLHLKKAQSLIVAVMVICNCQMRRTVVMMSLSMKVMDTIKMLKPDKAKMTYVANDEFNGFNYNDEYNYDEECNFDEL